MATGAELAKDALVLLGCKPEAASAKRFLVPTVPEQGCPLPSYEVPGHPQKVVWRLRNFRTAKLPCVSLLAAEWASSVVSISMHRCVSNKGRGSARRRTIHTGAKGRVQASPGQARSR